VQFIVTSQVTSHIKRDKHEKLNHKYVHIR